MKSIIIFFAMASSLVWSQEVRKSFTGLGVLISDEYREGKYLIYDCLGSYFACVDEDSFERCKERRGRSLEEKKFKLSCAPLKKFESFNECNLDHYKKMSNVVDKSFCLRSEKEIIKY